MSDDSSDSDSQSDTTRSVRQKRSYDGAMGMEQDPPTSPMKSTEDVAMGVAATDFPSNATVVEPRTTPADVSQMSAPSVGTPPPATASRSGASNSATQTSGTSSFHASMPGSTPALSGTTSQPHEDAAKARLNSVLEGVIATQLKQILRPMLEEVLAESVDAQMKTVGRMHARSAEIMSQRLDDVQAKAEKKMQRIFERLQVPPAVNGTSSGPQVPNTSQTTLDESRQRARKSPTKRSENDKAFYVREFLLHVV